MNVSGFPNLTSHSSFRCPRFFSGVIARAACPAASFNGCEDSQLWRMRAWRHRSLQQSIPGSVWARLRQRALDTGIREINQKADLDFALKSLERSLHQRMIMTLTFGIKTQPLKQCSKSGVLSVSPAYSHPIG